MNKNDLRKDVYTKRSLLDKNYFLDEQKRIIKEIENNKHFIDAKKIGIYYPLKYEINLLSLIKKYPNKKFYFPKTVKKGLEFKYVKDLKTLVDGPFNLKEPSSKLEKEENIDLYLVPCVATYKSYRIGHGAGYYDYYFKDHKGYKIGIVLTLFKNLSTNVHKHDIPMDEII